VIASVRFRRFKALRATELALGPFNLVIGPNGSGKTSLIESLDRLRALSKLPPRSDGAKHKHDGPEIEFRFPAPNDSLVVKLGCVSETVCDLLEVQPANAPGWPALSAEVGRIRRYFLSHEAMTAVAKRSDGAELRTDGSNLAAVLANLRERAPAAFTELTAELLRVLPEFRSVELVEHADDGVEFGLRLEEDGVVPAAELSQGVLCLLGVLVLTYDPTPPSVVCIEEPDRGIHPRMLREIRDLLYRLSYPAAAGLRRTPVQVVATTHSPYFIDLFRDHPEEVVISHKHGRAARFERLSDRPDLPELLREGSLGEMWFSGILGGVPEE
jgi:predicted ATPase